MTALLTLLGIGLLGVVAIGVVFFMIGLVLSIAFGLVGFLLFKVLPILLIGWLVVKLIDRGSCSRRLSSADRKWLDGE